MSLPIVLFDRSTSLRTVSQFVSNLLNESRASFSLLIVIFFDAAEDIAIADIAVDCYLSLTYRLFYAATGLFQMQAVVELALPCEGTHFGEIA